MKRNTTNRRSEGSAMLESLESRQLFSGTPVDTGLPPVLHGTKTQQVAQLSDRSNFATADQTAGETKRINGTVFD